MVKRCLWLICFLSLVDAAPAQTVFFDDFDGDALQPHWSVPPPSRPWEYNVSNSMLNVTELGYPGIPHLGGNFALIGAEYAPQMDFRADVWMGWEAGDRPHELNIHILAPTGHFIASFGYTRGGGVFGPDPVIAAFAGNDAAALPAPPPGIYHFTITRMAGVFDFYFEGGHLGSFPDVSRRPASIVNLDFIGPATLGASFGSLHVDRIQIIPAPASALILLCMLGRCAARDVRAVK